MHVLFVVVVECDGELLLAAGRLPSLRRTRDRGLGKILGAHSERDREKHDRCP